MSAQNFIAIYLIVVEMCQSRWTNQPENIVIHEATLQAWLKILRKHLGFFVIMFSMECNVYLKICINSLH